MEVAIDNSTPYVDGKLNQIIRFEKPLNEVNKKEIEPLIYNFRIYVVDPKGANSVEQYIDNKIKEYQSPLSKRIKYNVAGFEGVWTEGFPSRAGTIEIYVLENGKIFEFMLEPFDDSIAGWRSTEFRSAFEKMLSTFKFLDQDQTDETANWKTYTNTKYGFQFLHPNLDDTCCSISSPITGNPKFVAGFFDKITVQPGTDAPANGFVIAIEPNTQKLSFQDYVDNESKALTSNIFCGGLEKTTSISIGNSNGIQLTCKDNRDEYIIPFKNSDSILILTREEVAKGSFDQTFSKILSTFRFIPQ